jgi:alkanesulfonate monooxygenase SsuD/methylene tetrahydromethanopterin reductase-like flavin-dependent oxidoreductase (luciferase family)
MRVLGATERITVGTAISIPSAQHPVTLGEQTALFDHLSAGRFELGVGRGGPWMDLEVFQTGLDRYDRALAESLDLTGMADRRGCRPMVSSSASARSRWYRVR